MKMTKLSTSLLAILLGSLILSGCGYSLRGAESLSTSLPNLQLNLQNPNSEFSRLLRRSLDTAGVALSDGGMDSANIAASRLSVTDLRVQNQPVSVNPAARAAQYEIRLSIDIQLFNGEQELIPRETLTVERSYFEDIENIAGNQEEVEIITSEMRRELVNLLIRRLQAPTV